MSAPGIMATPRSGNRKTGDMPTVWIGRTREESKASCEGCPLLDGGCYAQFGSPAWAHSSMIRAAERGKRYGLAAAIRDRAPSALAIRVGAIGEPGRMSARWFRRLRQLAREAGLAVVGYTHRWRERPDLRGHLMASCDSLADVDRAVREGWRATVVLPADAPDGVRTPDGHRVTVCPAIRHPYDPETGEGVQCNTCRMCDPRRNPGVVIGFPDHGPKARKGKES